MLVGGYLSKQRAGAGPAAGLASGGLSGMPGGMLGAGQSNDSDDELDDLLKQGGQRNPLDDILGRLGR